MTDDMKIGNMALTTRIYVRAIRNYSAFCAARISLVRVCFRIVLNELPDRSLAPFGGSNTGCTRTLPILGVLLWPLLLRQALRGLPTFAHERGVQESLHAVVDALELRFHRALLLGKISHMYHGQPGRRDKAAMIRLRRRMSQAHNLQDVESLRTAMHAGWRPSFLYFWGHTPKDANVGKHVLSQWWPASFEVDGQAYPTAEH